MAMSNWNMCVLPCKNRFTHGFGSLIKKRDYLCRKLHFLGMGVMGYPMAGHIASAGHEVTVFNRTTAKAEAWATSMAVQRKYSGGRG